jgi:hypothetical protein
MGNMSYCRFENTANDLDDCLRAIEDGEYEDLNSYEQSGLSSLMSLCQQILEYKDEVEESLHTLKENK